MANDAMRGTGDVGERIPVVVLGMGNLLRRDEGLGIRALRRLEELYIIPQTVRLVDGGTLGLELLSCLEDADRTLVLDAALSEEGPGTLVQISGDDVPAYFGMCISPHEISLPDLLATARLRGIRPPEVVVVGMHPASIELGWELSEIVASRLDDVVASAAAVLNQWGLVLELRGEQVEVAGHPDAVR